MNEWGVGVFIYGVFRWLYGLVIDGLFIVGVVLFFVE